MKSPALPVLGGIRALIRLFLPEQCPGCHSRVAQSGLCPRCDLEIAELLAEPTRFLAGELPGIAAGPYSGRWRQVVLSFKKDPIPALREIVHERLWTALGEGGDRRARVVVPVPMAKVRRRERGWNPPEVLAERLAARAAWPLAPRLLERVRYGGTLASSGKEERARRLAGAIRLRPEWEEELGREAEGWPVLALLVDDVVTTGATLSACQEALFEAGFYDVLCLTLARTG